MTPDQMQAILETAMRDGVRFHWWAYCAAFLAWIAGVAAAAYVSKVYEGKAAERGFAALREQLRRTTEDTEAIRSALSGAQWLTQQQWSIRERRYSDLLLELARFQASLEDRLTFFHEPGSEDDSSIPQNKVFQRLARRGSLAMDALREQMGPAAVLLSKTAIDALTEMEEQHWHAVHFDSVNTEDYVQQAARLVETARNIVLAEAKADLGRPVLPAMPA